MKPFSLLSVIALLAVTWGLLAMPATAEAGKGKKKKGDVTAVFKKLDTDNDGKLSKEEFSKFTGLGKKTKAPSAKRLDRMFSQLDTNNDGFISLEEFKKISDMKGKKGKKKANT
jgi:Ca2+-binding EF-hand superfamily protein